jgi:3-phenylpropionate/trans-cinnamate dioxygenase ferredoxin reductase component
VAPRVIAIVGAGLSGGTAAATLRDEGFDGQVVLIGDEPSVPYERPGLSKGYLRGEQTREDLLVRDPDWWVAHDTEIRLGERVDRVDPAGRAVILATGERVVFDAVIVAPGVRTRTLPVRGADLAGIHGLRRIEEADAIRADAEHAGHAAIVGMGFIGAEVAASLRSLGLEVTVVEPLETAMQRVLGSQIGHLVEAIHRDHGTQLFFGDSLDRFEGPGRLERLVTSTGRTIECDLAIVGVGTVPSAPILPAEVLDRSGAIVVGPALETAIDGVFAVGDAVIHEHPAFGPLRVEHFDNAVKMGRHVARTVLGTGEAFDDPHWFWSDQYEHQIQMAGFAPVWDRMVVRGSVDERSFCAFFLDVRGTLRGSLSLDWPRDCRRSLPLIQAQARPDPEALADPAVDLRALGRPVSRS